jgi:DNA polymerase-3 subunit alpha
MVSFASYAFNKSHAAAYAVLSYETAYLKCHYPTEFMAALMSSMAGDAKHTADYVRNCREMGIELLPPSVMKSGRNFTAGDGKIRFGLLSVKNVGTGIIDAIIRGREEVPDTHDIYEFISAIDAGELNRKAIESLIQAGAFDDINPNRAVLMAVCDDAVQRAQKKARTGGHAQISLFQLDDFADEVIATPPLPRVADFPGDTKLAMEKDMLGVYLSGHPLDEYEKLISENTTASTSDLTSGGEEFTSGRDDGDSMVINTSKFRDGDFVILAGMLSGVRTMVTRKSQEMARVSLEDFNGIISAIAFPKVYEKKRNLIRNDQIVGLSGRVSFKDETDAEILIEDIVPIEDIAVLSRSRRGGRYDDSGYSGRGYDERGYAGGPGRQNQPVRTQTAETTQKSALNDPVKLRVTGSVLSQHRDVRSMLYHLTDAMSLFPGERDVLVYLPGQKPIRCSKESRVTFNEELRARLIRILGEENVKG